MHEGFRRLGIILGVIGFSFVLLFLVVSWGSFWRGVENKKLEIAQEQVRQESENQALMTSVDIERMTGAELDAFIAQGVNSGVIDRMTEEQLDAFIAAHESTSSKSTSSKITSEQARSEPEKRKAELEKRKAELEKRKAELEKRKAELLRQKAEIQRRNERREVIIGDMGIMWFLGMYWWDLGKAILGLASGFFVPYGVCMSVWWVVDGFVKHDDGTKK